MLTLANLKEYIDLKFELEELQNTEVTEANLDEYISRMMDVMMELEEFEES